VKEGAGSHFNSGETTPKVSKRGALLGWGGDGGGGVAPFGLERAGGREQEGHFEN